MAVENNEIISFNDKNISLDEKINRILLKLQEKKETHKNLATIWEKYILIKKEKVVEALKKAEIFLNKVNEILENDVSEKTLAFLYVMSMSNIDISNLM